MRTSTKSFAVAAVASLSLFTAACGSSDSEGDSASSDESTSAAPEESTAAADPAADLVGAGCADYAKTVPDGAGSVSGMSQDPVATAASNNPLLKTLTQAVSGQINPDVDLVDTLNGDEFTVFAPVDTAFDALFKQLGDEGVKTVSEEKGGATLSGILTYHVIPGQIAPADIDGTFKTVNGADLTVKGSGDDITVGEGNAKVICGGVKTANATVYLIDSVLMPAK
ncbi:fasciclin domain-containing protein [Aeromicrobium sp. SMF47]|uniref:fasciclin domain-containing protein n=1 Tax=Aeromicrobium TaxID=2040 RepID=UPI00129D7165|nr:MULTISPECIES: fasciclin domain-containing protein [Aeromicrobium]MRJ75750.1 fasciclin domain-containing protein [Aeromicrobium yanjiei]MRK00094.1 fasciclin domain-containing protein [Aeromicrobium sp. S22]